MKNFKTHIPNSHPKIKHCKSCLLKKAAWPYPFLLPDALFKVEYTTEWHCYVFIKFGAERLLLSCQILYLCPWHQTHRGTLGLGWTLKILRSETPIPTRSRRLRTLAECHCFIIYQAGKSSGSWQKKNALGTDSHNRTQRRQNCSQISFILTP